MNMDDLDTEERDKILPLDTEEGMPTKYERPPPRGGTVPKPPEQSPLSPPLTSENE